jgi:chemotaxis response regulator CheB
MPAEAIKTGAVNEVLALDDIAASIERAVAKIAALAPVGAR